jgi:hypothetical protein
MSRPEICRTAELSAEITGGFQMQLKKHLWLTAAILLAVGLASCNAGRNPEPTTDVNAVYTSVASTMIAQLNDQLTQTAQAVPPSGLASPTELSTLPPLPTISVETTLTPFSTLNITGSATVVTVFTPAGTLSSTAVGCADSLFIEDVNIPYGTVVKPGTVFQKIWRMENSGTCKWGTGFKFAFAYGSKFGGVDSTITQSNDFVPVGGTKDFGVKLTAPTIPNTYGGCWKMQTPDGYWFGQVACVTFKVSK